VGGDLAQIQLAAADGIRHALGILTGLHHGVADGPRGAGGQQGVGHQVVDNHVGQRDIHIIDAINTQQTANSALHRDGGVLVNEVLGVVRHLGGGGTRLIDQLHIQAEFAFHTLNLSLTS